MLAKEPGVLILRQMPDIRGGRKDNADVDLSKFLGFMVRYDSRSDYHWAQGVENEYTHPISLGLRLLPNIGNSRPNWTGGYLKCPTLNSVSFKAGLQTIPVGMDAVKIG
jgi:hypothetical protein